MPQVCSCRCLQVVPAEAQQQQQQPRQHVAPKNQTAYSHFKVQRFNIHDSPMFYSLSIEQGKIFLMRSRDRLLWIERARGFEKLRNSNAQQSVPKKVLKQKRKTHQSKQTNKKTCKTFDQLSFFWCVLQRLEMFWNNWLGFALKVWKDTLA